MTRTTPPDLPTARLIAAALDDARTDPRWAVAPQHLDVAGVLRRGTVRRRRARARGATAVALVAGGALVATAQLPGHEPRDSLRQAEPAAAPHTAPHTAPGTTVPGISPPWSPASGRDWLLPPRQFEDFVRTHRLPSEGPGQGSVASPAPLTALSAALEARARQVLPRGVALRREDAPGGEPGIAALHVRLPDGAPLEVQQVTLRRPVSLSTAEQCSCDAPPPGWTAPTVTDVPGTTSAAIVSTDAPYGLVGRDDRTESVEVVDVDGRATSWYAPVTVPLATLQDWAFAAAR